MRKTLPDTGVTTGIRVVTHVPFLPIAVSRRWSTRGRRQTSPHPPSRRVVKRLAPGNRRASNFRSWRASTGAHRESRQQELNRMIAEQRQPAMTLRSSSAISDAARGANRDSQTHRGKLTQHVHHFDRRQRGFDPLVTGLSAGAIQGLVHRLTGQDAKRYRHTARQA